MLHLYLFQVDNDATSPFKVGSGVFATIMANTFETAKINLSETLNVKKEDLVLYQKRDVKRN